MRYSSILLLNYLLYSFLPNHLIKKSTCSNSSFQFHSFIATQIPSRENGKPRNESITLTLKIHNILKHFYSLKKVSHSRSHTQFASIVFDFQVVQISIHCVKRVQIRSFLWSKYRKIQPEKNSVLGHFSRSDYAKMQFLKSYQSSFTRRFYYYY